MIDKAYILRTLRNMLQLAAGAAVLFVVTFGLWWFLPTLWDDCGDYKNQLFLENGSRTLMLDCEKVGDVCGCHSGDREERVDCSGASGCSVVEPALKIECWDSGLAF